LTFNEVEEEVIVLDDGLFDTSYLDAIESGEIQLAYIPESPVEELGDDPFDTSAVTEVVKKIHDEEVKEKRKINLGGAVDFFTKKTDVPQLEPGAVPYTDKTAEIKKTKRGRPVHVDLLGFDGGETSEDGVSEPPKPRNSNSQPVGPYPEKTVNKTDTGIDLTDLLREFETSAKPGPVTNKNTVSNLDLLTEPDHVEEEVSKVDEDDAWFQTDNENVVVVAEEVNSRRESSDVDPFDTSAVDKLGFGKAELKILEEELLPASSEEFSPAPPNIPEIVNKPEGIPEKLAEKRIISLEDDFDFDPRKDEPPAPSFHPLDIIHPDSNFDAAALTPQVRNSLEPEEIDPFDTSSISHISLPGKSELRLLEDELVSSNPVNPGLSQDYSAILNAQPLGIPNQDPFVTTGVLNPLDAPDDCISEILELRHPPLKSQPTLPSSAPRAQSPTSFEDPFDTSDVADAFAPGKNELRELESQLLNSTVDFVPPRVCPLRNFKVLHNTSITSIVTERQESLHPFDSIDGDSQVEHHRPLSPQLALGENCFDDPFDTSAVTGILPGKIEAKLLEEELAAASFQPVVTHRFERTENTFSLPPNSLPASTDSFPVQDFEEEEIDPFDTSIANSVVP